VRLVTGDRRPPLVMDDPFVTLDDERGKRALALLKEISVDFQVIYLTTSSRYDKTADKVCILPAPTALTPDPDGTEAPEPEPAPPPEPAPAPADAASEAAPEPTAEPAAAPESDPA
jgi:hypothetical protein